MRFNIIFILFYVILGLIVDTALWLLHPKAARKTWKIPYFTFCGLCYALLALGLALPWRNVGIAITPKMWILYIWLSIYVIKISMVIWGLIGLIPRLWKGKRITLGLYIGFPIGLICFATMWWGVWGGRRQIETVEIDVVSQRLPESFNGFSIAQISDLHLGSWGEDTSFVSKLVDSINSRHPDLIVFTGDIVNRDASEMKPFLSVLQRLKAPYGVFSIMGNHDYGSYGNWNTQNDSLANENTVRELQAKMGWRMLRNEHISLHQGNDSVIIIGVENWGEPPFKSYGDFRRALTHSVDSGKALAPYGPEFKVLLSHNPEHWRLRVRNESNTDLTLSGHTHAMQAELRLGNFRWSPSVWRYPAWGGLYATTDDGKTQPLLYVNVGAGEVGLPFRIGATPEITIITLSRKGVPSRPRYVR